MSNTSVCVSHDCVVVSTECARGARFFPHSYNKCKSGLPFADSCLWSKSDVTFYDINVGAALKDLQSMSLGVAMVAERQSDSLLF